MSAVDRWRALRLPSVALAVVLSCAVLGIGCSPSPPPETALATTADYVGRETCSGCHEEETALWQGSHHDLAMQPATAETVLGDFEEASFESASGVTKFTRRNGRYLVETEGPDGRPAEFEVAYTFGVEPLQQYLLPIGDGRLQALSVAWDARPSETGGQRWFHLYGDEPIDSEDPLHWTGPYQNWNHVCAECHSTRYRKGYDAAEGRFDSTWTEIDVSCEACHGPGSRHVAWARAAERDEPHEAENLGLEVVLRDRHEGSWEIHPETGIAQRTVERSSRQQVETCGRCHSRRENLVDEYRHGRALLDSHRPSLLEEGLYHSDGQILDEVYVYGSFLQSHMYAEGVTCSDCHDPHALTIASPDGICATCHAPERFATPSHHFHPTGSTGSSCVECHMVSRDYMTIDGRRDHSFRVPRPDLSSGGGPPNACTSCHVDRSDAWAAAAVEEWYGEPEPHYGEVLALGRRGGPGATTALERLATDLEVNGIVRATALSLLGRQPMASSLPVIEKAMADEDPLVRYGAALALGLLPPEPRWRLGQRALTDPVRSVRIEAARRLAAVPPHFRVGGVERFDAAVAELRQTLLASADRAPAQVALGTLAVQLDRPQEAESSFRRGLELDPTYAAAWANLADLYRALGRDDEGEELLKEGIERLPDDASLRHSLALLVVRRGRLAAALPELERAAELRPDVARYGYVWAVALESSGEPERAVEILERVHLRHPWDAEVLGALIGYLRQLGDAARANAYAQKLEELAPSDG